MWLPLSEATHAASIHRMARPFLDRGDVVRQFVPGVKCLAEFGDTHCYVGRWVPGAKVTDFTIKAGSVSRISIGYVIA